MSMTYRELKEILASFNDEQLDHSISLLVTTDDVDEPESTVFEIDELIVYATSMKDRPFFASYISDDNILDETSTDAVCQECQTPDDCSNCEFNKAIERIAQGEEP
jgi:hypothetical protein